MSINKELNEEKLKNVYGGPIKADDLPKKFKAIKEETELKEDELETVYGGPIKADDLPEDFYTSKDQNIKH